MDERELRIYEKPTMRIYGVPIATRRRLSVTSNRTSAGKNAMMSAKSVETLPAMHKPMPMTRLMLSRSPRPQYWLMSTLDPLCNPKTMSWMMKMGTFATVTADICSLPSRPTMKVSRKPSEVVMRFCTMMGRASRKSRR